MIPILSLLMALACAAASLRRLWFVANATALDPEVVLQKLGPARLDEGASIELLREAAASDPAADWERDLLSAFAAPDAQVRAALVNEQLTELDYRLQRWVRVPRVCASIATSFGFLLATLVLREGLADAGDLTGDSGTAFVRGLVGDAIAVAAFGLAGALFCITAQAQARRLAGARLKAADRLVERFERAGGGAPPDGGAPGTGGERGESPESPESATEQGDSGGAQARGDGEVGPGPTAGVSAVPSSINPVLSG